MPRAPRKRLTEQEERVVAMLTMGKSYAQISEALGVENKVISRMAATPLFKKEYDRSKERFRQLFESRVFAVANNGLNILIQAQQATKTEVDSDGNLIEVPDMKLRTEGAKISVNAGVRLAARYKELQVEGYAPPPTPLIVFPEGTRMPWMTPELPAHTEAPIDVEAEEVESENVGAGRAEDPDDEG